MCKIIVRQSSLLAGISLLQIIILIAVSIFDNWLVLLSIIPLLCITWVSESLVTLAYTLEKRWLLLRQKVTREVNHACFENEYLYLIIIWIILQSSLRSCLYFLKVIYYYGILSGTVSSINDTNMTSPKCGRAATHYLPKAVGLSFFCRPSLKGRYVTIRDLRGGGQSGFNLCEVEVYSEQRGIWIFWGATINCHLIELGFQSAFSGKFAI